MTGGTGGGFISTGRAGLINTYIGGLGPGLIFFGLSLLFSMNIFCRITFSLGTGFMMPSVQIPVPQMQIIPQQQHLLYNLQAMQLPFFNLQQSKVSTQCCMVSSIVPSNCSQIQFHHLFPSIPLFLPSNSCFFKATENCYFW